MLKIQSVPYGNIGGSAFIGRILNSSKIKKHLTIKCSRLPFDGDEMNAHFPQNILAETELRHLAAIQHQLISPSGNSPIIGIFQDSMIGSFRFTRQNINFTPREAMNLLMMYPHVDVKAIREKGNKITSFDIISQILPPLTLKYKTNLFDEDVDEYSTSNRVLEIHNGKYIRGQLEKSTLGSTTKGIIHRICNDYGSMEASKFIDNMQNVINEYMKSSSFSVGISDLIANKTTQDSILKVLSKQKQEVQCLIDKVHLGIFENNTASTNFNEFESNVNNILNEACNESGKIGRKSLSKTNRFVMIVNSGSKGSPLNISQMISCLGQTNVDGKRIPYGFDSRTLPHFSKFDDSPNARGFIENSYISGLTAPELFFHAMGGRIGLIDTAVKSVTWETPIVIIENNKPKYIEIGKWIDSQLDTASPEKVQHFTERQMELLNTSEVYIPTTDEDGIVTWGEITAITRHEPGDQLYEIKTSGGRSVIVTESKSLLIWNEETKKLKEMLTPDIKVGDCVPVTRELCEPPTVLTHILLTDYLPKTEYVYGTDFNNAVRMMNRDMTDKKKISSGWWTENNNKNFTLPYTKKSSLQRTITRSNVDTIKDGCVYPYRAIRIDTVVPDMFELNEENGIFLGLFLAEGNIHNSKIYITNNDKNIRSFVKQWFDKYSISHKETEKINKIGGTTTTVLGNSAVLSEFITRLVGKGAEHKHIPTEAYLAPNDFIVGLLNGYFSGDGTVSKNSVEAGSASKRLIEGINMLCSRLGIFGKVFKTQLKSNNLKTKNIKPTYRLAIRAQWGNLFANKIDLIEETKNKKLKSIKWGISHRNFNIYNDVVLDKIVEINLVDVKLHPKVYDLTIPSTLNFGLANGLQVRDTSQTGYIQRRLIKGLEDLKVEYDMTVRNNKGKIIQFAYGDDGFDSTRVENQVVPLVGLSTEDIYLHYDIMGINDQNNELLTIYSKSTLTRLKRQRTETKEMCKKYIEYMIKVRESLISAVFKNKNDNTVKVPVAFQNIINNIQGQLNLNANSIVDITPLEAFQLFEEYFEKLNKLKYVQPTDLFKVLYYFYLTPKELVTVKRFHRKALTILLETVLLKYKQAIVHPGEMVGIIAGQSLGEPTTQLTLNTFHNAGISSKSNVTRGVPRIEEILRLTKNPKNPSLTIHLNPVDETDKNKATQYSNMLEHTKLIDVVKSVQICFDPNDKLTTIGEDKLLMQQYYEFENLLDECLGVTAEMTEAEAQAKSKWLIRMEIDAETLLEKNITMDDIHFAITNAYGNESSCVYSDYNENKLIFRLRLNNEILNKKRNNKKGGPPDTLDQSDDIYLLRNFQDTLLNNVVLRGVTKIRSVTARKLQNCVVKEEGKYVRKDTWVLDTTGTNLMSVMALDYIDANRTYSNDIKEIFDVLGIEAARQVIFNEFSEVMEFSGGIYINYHHLSILCDRMTSNENMVSIFRSGILNDDIGPISKSTFEVHTEVLLNASRHADFDHMRGVSANIMMGQTGYFGTGSFQLVMDMAQMQDVEDKEVDTVDKQDEIDKLFGGIEDSTDICSKKNVTIKNNLVAVRKSDIGEIDDDYDIGF